MRRHAGAIRHHEDPVTASLPISHSPSRPKRKQILTGWRHKVKWVIGGTGVFFIVAIHIILWYKITRHEKPSKDHRHTVTPLTREIDREQYTIRINTWHRSEQLVLSVRHHAQCDGVARIQVVWCDSESNPPDEILNMPKVEIEYHKENSLNERFNILSMPPTLGILSMDDDVLRSCEAMDDGFFKWVDNPDRIVGYDTRLHIKSEEHWSYGYLSQSEKVNQYSITLPRYSFIHMDYLNLYMQTLPRSILNSVAEQFNCEDIAMSFFVSSLTGGQPPLLADFWAVKSMVKLYSPSTISSTDNHKTLRDQCVENFANVLGLKGVLQSAKAMHSDLFEYGAKGKVSSPANALPRRRQYEMEMKERKSWPQGDFFKWVASTRQKTSLPAEQIGLVKGSKKWTERWDHAKHSTPEIT